MLIIGNINKDGMGCPLQRDGRPGGEDGEEEKEEKEEKEEEEEMFRFGEKVH